MFYLMALQILQQYDRSWSRYAAEVAMTRELYYVGENFEVMPLYLIFFANVCRAVQSPLVYAIVMAATC